MTQSIHREAPHGASASPAPAAEPVVRSCRPLITGIRCFVAGMLTAGICAAVWACTTHGRSTHLVIIAGSCFCLAGMGGAVLALQALLADRQEFYRRGQLDGWMRGWRGQEPDAGDPLLR